MPAAGPSATPRSASPTTPRSCVRALGDRVKHWIVFNEPKTFTSVGYWNGAHAPGRKDPLAFVRSTHVINLAQGMAVRAIKAVDGASQVGSVFDVAPMYPATRSPEDVAAAERWHRFQNLWFIQPALRGTYPEGVLPADRQAALLDFRAGDEKILRAPYDFVGLNYYTPTLVKAAPQGNGVPGLDTEAAWATMHGNLPKTDIGWTVYAQGFYDILTRMVSETGRLPIEITENGASYNTAPAATEKSTMSSASPTCAITCAWSRARSRTACRSARTTAGACSTISSGPMATRSASASCTWTSRKGQRRTIKDSGRWYAEVAASNRVAAG